MKKDLLKEAIADAKAVRETALANAKIALEEAFAPKLQRMISAKLQQEMEDDEENQEEPVVEDEVPVEDEIPVEDEVTEDEVPAIDDEEIPVDDEVTEDEVPVADEEIPVDDELEVTEDEEVPVADDDEVELESIIKELEAEDEEIPVEDEVPVEETTEGEEDEEVSIEEVINALREDDAFQGDSTPDGEASAEAEEDEELHEDEVPVTDEVPAEDEVTEVKAELKEAYKAIQTMRKSLNETNLLNAKLLFSNKLFKTYDLNEGQKRKVIDNFDRAQTIREVKLVYATLAESFKMPTKRKINESVASRVVGTTAPKKEILSESNAVDFVSRMKHLAGIKPQVKQPVKK
ncbi:MAG: hypothetical protein UT24_C0046G0010 [Candidatus Woesebacteria bacterium GW2011_GWB1_39_12]|uniref:Uncharacterized protein n=1 Tax=Candidatus Woesebacteria bacterium GW2011_GWB1_39_12 TaxID=1618574 RepID=A0A0G0M075_9BACT|nr:MAG: hypothetical protein UT24_C0046G0010 [Candidatus Woesebacteria bacterium GW2011_GWB1_39_12]